MAQDERPQALSSNAQMGIVVVVVVMLYLFFGLTGERIMTHTFFYLIMFLGAILGAMIVFKDEVGDKLHFTTKSVPMINVILYGVGIGLMLATIETVLAGGTVFIQQATEPTLGVAQNLSQVTDLLSAVVFIGLFSFITANAEETLTRGFFNAIAENYSDSDATKFISKYILIPLIFSLLHYFMWTSSGLLNIGGGLIVIFLIFYHFVFGVICQFSMDVTKSIYTPIAIHTIYNTIKMLMVLGIIVVGVGV